MVDGVCEPIAQWRVSASEPKAREREKVEKKKLANRKSSKSKPASFSQFNDDLEKSMLEIIK